MGSTMCSNCGQPLPAGAAFCGNCGARQNPANQNAPTQLTPPPALGGETMKAGAPPGAGNDYAPTQFQPPPAPAVPAQGGPAMQDVYASQYQAAPVLPPPPYPPYAGPGAPGGAGGYMPPAPGPQGQMTAPPPGYAPGPPPVAAPGGGVQPWAQPPKKKGRGRLVVGCLVALVLVVAVLGGGGYLLVKAFASKGGTTTQQGNGTPGAGSTPGTGSTPGGNPSGTQTLNAINRHAIYAGAQVVIISAVQAASFPEEQPSDPNTYVLKIQMSMDNQSTHGIEIIGAIVVVGPNGTPYDAMFPSGANTFPLSLDGQVNATGSVYFLVPKGSKIGDWQLVIGNSNEVLVKVPLTGNYDASQWQETPRPIGKSVTYYGGALVGTVVKVATGVWTPGYQAPKGMRFILVDLMVTNNSAADAYVGDPEFVLLLPSGERHNQTGSYGYLINDDLGGHESKDEGYASFLAPPDKGDFQIIFFNKNNGIAGQIDLGTL